MNRRAALLLLLVAAAAGGLAWMHFSVVPGIRWSNGTGVFYDGWEAIVKAWPIYLTTGTVAALISFMLFGFIGESERERSHKQRAEKAEAKSASARKDAENAAQRAQAALEDKQREAREMLIEAKALRAAAARETERAQSRIVDLEYKLAHTNRRLDGARAAMQRAKQRKKAQQEELERQQNEMANASRDQAESGVDPVPPWLSD